MREAMREAIREAIRETIIVAIRHTQRRFERQSAIPSRRPGRTSTGPTRAAAHALIAISQPRDQPRADEASAPPPPLPPLVGQSLSGRRPSSPSTPCQSSADVPRGWTRTCGEEARRGELRAKVLQSFLEAGHVPVGKRRGRRGEHMHARLWGTREVPDRNQCSSALISTHHWRSRIGNHVQ